MAAWRTSGLLAVLLALPAAGKGQTYNLTEAPKPGDTFRVAVETDLAGALKVVQDGKENSIKISARNEHVILERVLKADAGVARKSARFYEKASCAAEIGGEKTSRGLRDDFRLVVAQRHDDSLLCYSPAGPLTRPELEVISEHFDTLSLTGLLPEKEVAVGDSWKISNATAQALCLFEGLVSQDLTGRLKEVKNGQAVIAVEGKAAGIELGASVKLEITAAARFDVLKRRLVALEWKQKDARDQGPASPASEAESTTTLKRELLTDEPKELSRAALAGVPQEDEPQEVLKLLQHRDPAGRYALLYPRDWHVVTQTESHLVLRLLDRGDFIAQATIAGWKKADPGKHTDPQDFQKVIGAAPGWEIEEVVESAEVPTDEGRWLYRVTAKGTLDGAKVVQSFILLAGPQGDQVVVTFTMKPANAARIGTRDVALVNAIEFAGKK
jgi:hypothetical protein